MDLYQTVSKIFDIEASSCSRLDMNQADPLLVGQVNKGSKVSLNSLLAFTAFTFLDAQSLATT